MPPLRSATAPLRLGLMLARLAWLLGRGSLTMAWQFPALDAAARKHAIRVWSRATLSACGVDLEVSGAPSAQACLLAINHISWLDIIALNATHPTRFVAKSDVNHWPVLGRLARGVGTLFVERERPRDAMRVMHAMAACLGNGDHVSVFPEGTTSDGTALLPMHANLFQAAVSAGVPVQPVVLRYLDATTARISPAPAYVGDDTMLDTLRRIAAAPPLRVHVHFLPPVHGRERRALAQEVQHCMARELCAPISPVMARPAATANATE